jgi:hypothetical protein
MCRGGFQTRPFFLECVARSDAVRPWTAFNFLLARAAARGYYEISNFKSEIFLLRRVPCPCLFAWAGFI